MKFESTLASGTLLRRYKRFLTDVRTADGQRRTMHCPNTGAMLGCSNPGATVYFSSSANTKRKYPETLELVETTGGQLICVNTNIANKVVGEALAEQRIAEVHPFNDWRAEIKIPDESGRFDFGVDDAIYIEVKSVTYAQERRGLFPDARSERATKHVRALARRVEAGQRGVLLFCVLHQGVQQAGIAKEIDPTYFDAVRNALESGVEVLAYYCQITTEAVEMDYRIPFTLD